MSLGGSMDVELSVETAALATALTEKGPKTALAPAKLALNSGVDRTPTVGGCRHAAHPLPCSVSGWPVLV